MALPASLIDEDEDDPLQQIATLSPKQYAVLNVILNPECAGFNDTQIARKAGVDRTQVWRYRQNPAFLMCLSELTKRYAKSNINAVIEKLKQNALEGSNKAIELLIKYTGDYIPTQRNENLNANIDLKQNMNAVDMLDGLLIQLGKSGITVDMIVDRYIQLKNQNAF